MINLYLTICTQEIHLPEKENKSYWIRPLQQHLAWLLFFVNSDPTHP